MATPSKKKVSKRTPKSKITLIQSDSATPAIKVRAGTKIRVEKVSIARPDGSKPQKMAARLCSGGGTCLALITLDD